jgi:hypothetical protein
MPFGLKNVPPTYQWTMNTSFKDYLGMFMKLFLDDFSDLNTHLTKLRLCFHKCTKFSISLNPKKCMFLMHLGIILGYVVFKESKRVNAWMGGPICHTTKVPICSKFWSNFGNYN